MRNYPPTLTTEQDHFLLHTLNDWCSANGLTVRPAADAVGADRNARLQVLATPAPVTLFPSLFPRDCFEEAVGLQTAYNELYARVASDEIFLEGVVKE